MSFASGLGLYGAQVLARGDVAFSASSDGVQGVSIVAGGTISGTSGLPPSDGPAAVLVHGGSCH